MIALAATLLVVGFALAAIPAFFIQLDEWRDMRFLNRYCDAIEARRRKQRALGLVRGGQR